MSSIFFLNQDVEIIEDGSKHTLTLYNCKVAQTGEVVFQGANAKCAVNLKVKGSLLCSPETSLHNVLQYDVMNLNVQIPLGLG